MAAFHSQNIFGPTGNDENKFQNKPTTQLHLLLNKATVIGKSKSHDFKYPIQVIHFREIKLFVCDISSNVWGVL